MTAMTATPYFNSEGEMLGIDYHYEDAPDPDEYYDRYDGVEPEWSSAEDCEHGDRDQVDLRTGRAHLEEMPTREAIVWQCINPNCEKTFSLTDAEFDDWNNAWNFPPL